ncbi:MAG: hypothetical protein ACJAXM_001263 [Arenicella sp.]|jgi:hypothetical protein
MKLFKYLLLVFIIPFVLSCSSSIDEYENTKPEFDLPSYFDGEVTAWGIVQDYSNKLTRRFCVDIVGTWQGNKGQLHETFYYNDGEQQVRIWELQIAEDGSVSGSAADVIGKANGGSEGAAFNWQYTLRVPIDDTEYDLFVDDWMFMIDSNRMMNRSYMKKLGITVAEISIFFDKTKPVRKCG